MATYRHTIHPNIFIQRMLDQQWDEPELAFKTRRDELETFFNKSPENFKWALDHHTEVAITEFPERITQELFEHLCRNHDRRVLIQLANRLDADRFKRLCQTYPETAVFFHHARLDNATFSRLLYASRRLDQLIIESPLNPALSDRILNHTRVPIGITRAIKTRLSESI